MPRSIIVDSEPRTVLRLPNSDRKPLDFNSLSSSRTQNEPKKSPSTKSLIAAQKRSERSKKREERAKTDKSQMQFKTAFEIAFTEAKDKTQDL
jgi:hypothetical protein